MANINKANERRIKEWQIKSDIELKQKIDELRRIRYGAGLDKDLISYNELIKGAFRFEPLIETLKKAEIKRSREKRI